MLKNTIPIIVILLLTIPTLAQTQPPQPTDTGLLLKFISQEHQNTKDYVKTEIERQMQIQHQDIQAQVDDNKQIFFKELNNELKTYAFRMAILWFATTFLALLLYRLTMMRITRKYRHVKFRDEILG